VKHKRIMGIDLGEKNVGVAVSDELGLTAQGLTCLKRTEESKFLDDLCRLVREKAVKLIVLGLPKKMSGEIGSKAREAMEFAEKLRGTSGIEVSLWDERLTTVQAERSMLEGDLSRKKRKKRRDIIAAQLILQSFLDSQRQCQSSSEKTESKVSRQKKTERAQIC